MGFVLFFSQPPHWTRLQHLWRTAVTFAYQSRSLTSYASRLSSQDWVWPRGWCWWASAVGFTVATAGESSWDTIPHRSLTRQQVSGRSKQVSTSILAGVRCSKAWRKFKNEMWHDFTAPVPLMSDELHLKEGTVKSKKKKCSNDMNQEIAIRCILWHQMYYVSFFSRKKDILKNKIFYCCWTKPFSFKVTATNLGISSAAMNVFNFTCILHSTACTFITCALIKMYLSPSGSSHSRNEAKHWSKCKQ